MAGVAARRMAPLARVIAHRGASGDAPENTLRALQLAAEQGAHCVEIDAMISADDVPVVHHDDTLERCTDGEGPVSALSAAELDRLDASCGHPLDRREPLPRLSAVLDWLARQGMALNLELKPEPGLDIRTTDAVADLIDACWQGDNTLVFSSFSRSSLVHLQQRLPDIPRALLVERGDGSLLDTLRTLDCSNLHIADKGLDTIDPREVLGNGYGLYVYTVNDVARARELLSLGVHGVFTDYPGRLLQGLAHDA